ncbi:MAG TPA: LLM class flavin-dependent oxidoreductase [Ktedonobacterales bacterium]|nr:LLM class flavin-dependent oxidoreductase [Ktedonobacterales bacterium]
MTQSTSQRKMKLGLIPSIDEGEFNGQTARFSDLRDTAVAAEQAGFDSLWLADHLIFRFPGRDEKGMWEVFTFLSGLAAATSRIQLGPLVACTSFRNPALTAKMADSLDEISNGRFILGLGAGWHEPEYRAYGLPFDHLASRFEEALKIILPLLREGHVDFEGTYYQARNAVLRPRGPSKGHLPIMIGAGRPRMLELTARYADIWNTTGWTQGVDHIASKYPALLEACQKVGRDPATIEFTAAVGVQLLAPGETKPANAPELSGTPEEVAEMLRKFVDIGLKHLIVALEPDGVEGVERFARVIELLDQG